MQRLDLDARGCGRRRRAPSLAVADLVAAVIVAGERFRSASGSISPAARSAAPPTAPAHPRDRDWPSCRSRRRHRARSRGTASPADGTPRAPAWCGRRAGSASWYRACRRRRRRGIRRSPPRGSSGLGDRRWLLSRSDTTCAARANAASAASLLPAASAKQRLPGQSAHTQRRASAPRRPRASATAGSGSYATSTSSAASRAWRRASPPRRRRRGRRRSAPGRPRAAAIACDRPWARRHVLGQR